MAEGKDEKKSLGGLPVCQEGGGVLKKKKRKGRRGEKKKYHA